MLSAVGDFRVGLMSTVVIGASLFGTGVMAQSAGGPQPPRTTPAEAGTVALPTIDVTALTPLPGTGIDIDKNPSAVTLITRDDIARTQSPDIVKSLTEQTPGISVTESSGNTFQPDVVFRGFVASPVSGTPEGLAVYQNGVRINEAFGDTVNWDLIPTVAVRDISVVSNNPAFGLNALGGAVTVQMKDGFTFHGIESELQGGSFGRIEGSLEGGKQIGDFSTYLALEGIHEDGFRRSSSVDIRRLYGDLGYRANGGEYHFNVGLADNLFGATASAPVQLLQQDYGAVYTTPQTTTNRLGQFNMTGSLPVGAWTFQGNAYVRLFDQRHVDGNTTDVQPCDDPSLLCFGDGSTPANGLDGRQLSNGFDPDATLGEIDRTRTSSRTVGGTIQATNVDEVFGHPNHVVVGASVDAGSTDFSANSELGVIGSDFAVAGSGLFLGASGDPVTIGPVSLHATNTYGGLYAIDNFDVTDRLTLTGGGRLNVANIDLQDRLGGALNGDDTFVRFNPIVGGTFKLTPEIGAYASYSEANRAPTPLELGCADPNRPCIIDSFLVSDPALKQVVSRTVETGLRGTRDLGAEIGQLGWKLGGFRTENSNDILDVPSEVQGFGYFRNVGRTVRQGVEAEANLRSDDLFAYINYAYVDATFRNAILLSSPNNPYADSDGNIQVQRGDQIPLVPHHRLKAGLDYKITPAFTLGSDLLYTGSQRFVGDESNLNPKLPSYVTVGLHSTYQISKNFQVFGRIENLFDRHYYNYGTYFETDAIAFGNFTDPRSVSPGRPRAFYAGIRATF